MLAGSLRNRSLWTPERINPLLWLDAADNSTITTVSGGISEWRDKSGNNFHALQSDANNRPVLQSFNGLNSVFFQGNPKHLSIFSSVIQNNDNFTAIAVQSTRWGRGIDGVTGAGFWSFFLSNGINQFDAAIVTQFPSAVMVGSTTLTNTIITNPSIKVLRFEQGATIGHGNNGTYSQRNIINSTLRNSGSRIDLGRSNDPNTYSVGILTEILMFNSAISTVVRQKTEGYLAHKWGMVANLPTNHPFKNYPPRGL